VFNLAALHRLPLLIICEKQPLRRAYIGRETYGSPSTLLAEPAKAFVLPAVRLDGNNPEALLRQLDLMIPNLRSRSDPQFVDDDAMGIGRRRR
jgi:TPP-dependent pyruvate/acetoin dehydrogenase alpha subunit